MLSDTVIEGLDRYTIGEKLRKLRLKKKIGLVELGQHTGLSPALISKIETGKIYPTLPTLLRLALVFGVGLEHFFKEDEARSLIGVVRGETRQRFPSDPDGGHISYYFESLDYQALDRKLDAFLAGFEPPPDTGTLPLHEHDGAEFIYVVSGSLILLSDNQTFQLHAGDSVYFNSAVPHGYCRTGKKACTAVVVVVPSNGE